MATPSSVSKCTTGAFLRRQGCREGVVTFSLRAALSVVAVCAKFHGVRWWPAFTLSRCGDYLRHTKHSRNSTEFRYGYLKKY